MNELALSIDNLFNGRQVAKENLFIHQYAESEECWNSAMLLLDSPHVHIRYFSANIIYNKVIFNFKL